MEPFQVLPVIPTRIILLYRVKNAGDLHLLGISPGVRNLKLTLERFGKRKAGCVILPDDALMPLLAEWDLGPDLEVITFSSLVTKLLSILGVNRAYVAAPKLRLEAMVVAADKGDFSIFRNLPRFEGLQRSVDASLVELAEHGIDLEPLVEAIEEGALRNKLSELLQLKQGSEALLNSIGRLNPSQAYSMLDLSEFKPEGCLERILFVAGKHPSPMMAMVATHLKEVGCQVWWVTESAPNRALFGCESDVAALLGLCVPIEGESGLGDLVFSHDNPSPPDPLSPGKGEGGLMPKVRIETSVDALTECEWALRGCLKELRRGTSAGQITIFCRDMESYGPLLIDAARRLAVPIRIPTQINLLSNGFARLILDSIEICAGKDVAELSKILPSSYMHLTVDEMVLAQDLLREARKTDLPWQLAQQQLAPHPWAQTLVSLIEWRGKVLNQTLRRQVWLKAVQELMSLWDADLLFGSSMTQQRDVRAQSAMLRAIAYSASVFPDRDEQLTFQEFARLARSLWENEEVSVPAQEVGILVTDRADALGDLSYLHILGMLEGDFPSRRSENEIFGDFDREEINRALPPGAFPLWSSHDLAQQQRDDFVRLCSAPTGTLVASYPLTGEDRDNVPALYLRELERVASPEKVHYDRSQWTPEDEDPLSVYDEGIQRAKANKVQPLETFNSISEETKALFPWPDGRGFQPRQLARIRECAYRFFVDQRLKLPRSSRDERWQALLRLPISAQLPVQPDAVRGREALESALAEWISTIQYDVGDTETRIFSAVGQRLVEGWLQREFSSRAYFPRSNVQVNVPFGDFGLKRQAIPDFVLAGSVDAFSEMDGIPMVTLYRATQPKQMEKFSPTKSQAEQERILVEFGLVALSAMIGKGAIIEIDSVYDNLRCLYYMGKDDKAEKARGLPENLRWYTFATDEMTGVTVNRIGFMIKDLSLEGASFIQRVEVAEKAGNHCQFCDFGEVCRRHRDYGEQERTDFIN